MKRILLCLAILALTATQPVPAWSDPGTQEFDTPEYENSGDDDNPTVTGSSPGVDAVIRSHGMAPRTEEPTLDDRRLAPSSLVALVHRVRNSILQWLPHAERGSRSNK